MPADKEVGSNEGRLELTVRVISALIPLSVRAIAEYGGNSPGQIRPQVLGRIPSEVIKLPGVEVNIIEAVFTASVDDRNVQAVGETRFVVYSAARFFRL